MKKLIITLLIILCLPLSAFAVPTEVKVPVLLYHNVAEEYAPEDALLHITPDLLREHMEALVGEGYTPITLTDYYDFLSEGVELPEKSVIITFDDGYISNYTYAYPLLKEMGLKATIFIITETVGSTTTDYPHFTWEEAIEMEESGVIDIQSHSHSHRAMALLNFFDINKEMRYSKYLIEVNMGKECSFMAFPYGSYNEVAKLAARYAGYKFALIVGDKGFNTADSDPYELKRLTARGDQTGAQLLEMIENELNPVAEDGNMSDMQA